jgi:aldehyde:ferredoxin oxidoreductase
LIIRGRSPSPVYLSIEQDRIGLHDAKSIWGLQTREAESRLKENLHDSTLKTMTIGPGGESGVLFGCIISDGDHAAGRTGMGTVMGFKNLKAIVLKPAKQGRPKVADTERRNTLRRYVQAIKGSAEFKTLSLYGGAGYIKWANDIGILATRNYRANRFAYADHLDGREISKSILRSRGCRGCPVRCKAELQTKNGRFGIRSSLRPEFEAMVALGSKCGLDDPEAVIALDNLCSCLGLDNISTGSVIAFAMDLFDRGILTLEDTGGLDLSWGNASSMETLIRQMVAQQSLGGILAQGVRRASRVIGKGAEKFAPQIKGLELSGYHPQGMIGTALGYAVSSRGGDFNDVYASLEYRRISQPKAIDSETRKIGAEKTEQAKAAMVKQARVVTTVLDCLGLCKVPPLSLLSAFDLQIVSQLAGALSGQTITAEDLFRVGERTIHLERLFNLRHGLTAADDCLPQMFFEAEYNPAADNSLRPSRLHQLVQAFYETMGWDAKGCPLPNTLRQMQLENPDRSPGRKDCGRERTGKTA